jgi:hypothetical protein
MRKQKVPELIEFVHTSKEIRPDGVVKGVGPHVGCVLARRIRVRSANGRFRSAISIGWSQVNRASGDEFNKEWAIRIARGRAIKSAFIPFPHKLTSTYCRVLERAERYFKNIDWA